jgi:hypothetical protein
MAEEHMLADVLHFIEFILIFALALVALFIVLLIVVSMMPKSNPLRIMLTALAHRVGVTAGLMMLDPVATALPVAGEVWDLITIIGLIYFWYTFFKQLPVKGAAWSNSPEHSSLSKPRTTNLRRGMISDRTKKAVAAAKANGKKIRGARRTVIGKDRHCRM